LKSTLRFFPEIFFTILIILLLPSILPAQEALKSIEEEYYDTLAIMGLSQRPTLTYRTLSDSVWAIDEDATHIWQNQNLGIFHPLFGDFRMRVYGPELFMSVNTTAPYGQNDGVLWQGKGFNALLKGGVRFEGYGIELTLLPHFSFSQNLKFDFIQPNYPRSDKRGDYTGKAELYGYYGVRYIDAPQRFGDKPFFDWDFGDSEIRYTWKTLTVGFGTQLIWLGPAQLNPIIHSNNATSYPKLDLGLRRQSMITPKRNWHLGDVELRAWWGYLSESDYFDNSNSNDHNLITGFSFAYSFPYLLKGLTFGLNRIMLSKWDDMNYGSILSLLIPNMNTSMGFGDDNSDQRASIIIDYFLPIAGLNIYLEWARNDFSPGLGYIIRYPFHTEGYTVGIKKTLSISHNLKGEILLEITKLESSQDYDRVIPRYSTFYAHHIITQGHTNQGQWLGAGIGTGGNSQYLGLKLYFPKGYGNLFIQRRNPDLDYTWYIDSKKYDNIHIAEYNIRAFLDFGISGLYFIIPNLSVTGSFVFRYENNPLNVSSELGNAKAVNRFNSYFSASIKYSF
jgi:hypothetical protein